MSGSWKLSLPCTRAEAEALKDDIAPLAWIEPAPALMTSEIDAAKPDDWRLDAYFESEPDMHTVTVLKDLVPSAAQAEPVIEQLGDEDWVTLSQHGLEPIYEGRFVVHTPRHRDRVPEGAIAFEIEAGRAFGTGQHETTAGCLAMLDRLSVSGRRYRSIADIGTGTGLLAFAARVLWPGAAVIASDIDPVAIDVARENARLNDVPVGSGRGSVALLTAAGLAHRDLKRRAPYDLLIANILAKPLIDLAPALAGATAPGGTLVLAGLLQSQADDVAAAYRRQRCRLAGRIDRGDWAILRLQKRPAPPHKPASRA